MAKRYSRRRRRVWDVDRKGLIVLYSTDPSRPPTNEDRQPIRTLPIHLYRRYPSYRKNDKETCIKERHIPGRHLVQVQRRILRQTCNILGELERLHEAIRHLQLDVIEMDWDYSPTTASLCYVVDNTSQTSNEMLTEQYSGIAGAWHERHSTGGVGGSDLGSEMEICDEGEEEGEEEGEVSSSSQEDFSETYLGG